MIGDRALHARVGDEFWNDVVETSRPYFARGETLQGIVHAVGRVGRRAARALQRRRAA